MQQDLKVCMEQPQAEPVDDKTARVRTIFCAIAQKYERFNRLSSFGIYRRWLHKLAKTAACKPTDAVIDVAGGTGDVTFELCAHCPPASVELTDLTREMLDVANRHLEQGAARGVPVRTRVVDAQHLPYADKSFDVYTVAYGLRNFKDRRQSMREAARVLKPGGTYVALEFSTPPNPVWRALYGFYLRHAIPFIGGLLFSDRSGFDYLVSSIQEFPPPQTIVDELQASGFSDVTYSLCTGGIATMYCAHICQTASA